MRTQSRKGWGRGERSRMKCQVKLPGIMQGVGARNRPPSQWWFAKGWGKTELGKRRKRYRETNNVASMHTIWMSLMYLHSLYFSNISIHFTHFSFQRRLKMWTSTWKIPFLRVQKICICEQHLEDLFIFTVFFPHKGKQWKRSNTCKTS